MLLCLLKLSVPNKTIAQYLCIDEQSVVKQKHRIREQIRQHSGAAIDKIKKTRGKCIKRSG